MKDNGPLHITEAVKLTSNITSSIIEKAMEKTSKKIINATERTLNIIKKAVEHTTKAIETAVNGNNAEKQNKEIISSSDKAIIRYQPHIQTPPEGYNFLNIPEELLIEHIFQFLPLAKHVTLREVNKQFTLLFEKAAQLQIRNSRPLTRNLLIDKGVDKLITDQKAEIKYLIDNKAKILKNKNNIEISSKLEQLFGKLDSSLLKGPNMVAYYEKEKYLNDINATIIRNQIASCLSESRDILKLTDHHLTRFPDELFRDEALQEFWRSDVTEIWLSRNNLAVLPTGIGQCAALQWLIVSNNKIIFLPDSIGQCTELSVLHADGNKLTTLPDSIGKCTELNMLNVGNNEINNLTDSISQCVKLKFLIITENNLSTFPYFLPENIILYYNNGSNIRINIAQCLASQKKPLVENEEKNQVEKRSHPH